MGRDLHPWRASCLGETEPWPIRSSVGNGPILMCTYTDGANHEILCFENKVGLGSETQKELGAERLNGS